MKCDQRQDLILLYAVGALDQAEEQELRAHLAAGCVTCAGRLAEAEAVVAHLPLSLEQQAAPSGARDKLLAGLSSRRGSVSDRIAVKPTPAKPSIAERSSSQKTLLPWLTATAAAVAAVWFGITSSSLSTSIHEQTDQIAQLRQQVGNRDSEINELEVRLDQLNNSVERATSTFVALRTPSLDIIELAGADPQPGARGRILWDHENRVWLFFATDMTPAAANKTFELWFVTTDERKIPAGTFNVDAQGTAYLQAPLPEGIDAFALAAVTDEPIGGSAQPTGIFQMLGRVE